MFPFPLETLFGWIGKGLRMGIVCQVLTTTLTFRYCDDDDDDDDDEYKQHNYTTTLNKPNLTFNSNVNVTCHLRLLNSIQSSLY